MLLGSGKAVFAKLTTGRCGGFSDAKSNC